MSQLEAVTWIVAIAAVTIVATIAACRDRHAVHEYRARLARIDEDLRGLEYAVVDPDAVIVTPRPRSLRSYPRVEHLDRVPVEHVHLYREKLRYRAMNLRLVRGAVTIGFPLALAYWLDDLMRLTGGTIGVRRVESDGILAGLDSAWLASLGAILAIVAALLVPGMVHVWVRGELKYAAELRKAYEKRLQVTSKGLRPRP